MPQRRRRPGRATTPVPSGHPAPHHSGDPRLRSGGAQGGVMGRLDGKVAIVTGGARGQGGAEAALFRAEGAEVVVTDVLRYEGQAHAEEIGATFIAHDVRSEEEWAEVVRQALERHGRIDVLVNNAGIFHRAKL